MIHQLASVFLLISTAESIPCRCFGSLSAFCIGSVPDPDGAVVLERGHDFEFCPNTPHLFIFNAQAPPATLSWRDEIFPLLHRLDILAPVHVCNDYKNILSTVIVTCHPPFQQNKSLPLTIQTSLSNDRNNSVVIVGVVSIMILACLLIQMGMAVARDPNHRFRFRLGTAAEGVAGDGRR